MNKFYISLLTTSISIFSASLLKAQIVNKNFEKPGKYWSVELEAGLELMSSTPNNPLISQRPSSGFQPHINFAYHFSKKWGVYAGYGFNAYDTQRPTILDPDKVSIDGNDLLEDLFGRFKKFKPTINAGILYSIHFNRFELLPNLGLAYTVNDWGRDRQLTIKANNTKLHYTMKGAVSSLQLGINLNYWVAKSSYIHFGVLAESPIQKPYGKAIYLRGAEPMKTEIFKSSTFGQNLFIKLGYGFTFGNID